MYYRIGSGGHGSGFQSSGSGGAIAIAKRFGLDTIAAHDLLQRLSFQAAKFGGLGDIALAFGQKIVNIASVEIYQNLFFGLFIRQILK